MTKEGVSEARNEGAGLVPWISPAEERRPGCATCLGRRDIRAERKLPIALGHIDRGHFWCIERMIGDIKLMSRLSVFGPGYRRAPPKNGDPYSQLCRFAPFSRDLRKSGTTRMLRCAHVCSLDEICSVPSNLEDGVHL